MGAFTMCIDTDTMSGKMKKLYQSMWGDFDFSHIGAEISRSPANGGRAASRNSCCFAGGEDKRRLLAEIFGIENPAHFRKQFDMAVSGSGEEIRRITTLHSSALCALLFFYNVTEKNPLTLCFSTCTRSRRRIRFNESVFEYKSPVIDHPSNMDVVLLGEDGETDEKTVLFLESKFSEYYVGAALKSGKISVKYLENDRYSAPFYEKAFLKTMGLEISDRREDFFRLLSYDGAFYIGGIKQMISHFVGIRNVLDGNYHVEREPEKNRKQRLVEKAVESGAGVILGEILFDLFPAEMEDLPGTDCRADYGRRYGILARRMAEVMREDRRFEVIKEELGYSLFVENAHRVERNIRLFYGM